MAMRIWHQSFTVLDQLPAYAARLQEHFRKVARPDTEVVLHGMHPQTYRTNYPGTDIRYGYVQYLHGQQFVMGGIAAEEAGFDAYAIMSIPEPALRETRSLVDIPVVGYGESSMLLARMLGERMGVLLFIEQMTPIIEENAARIGLQAKFGGARFVGFTFDDVLKAYDEPASLLERFHEAARAMIRDGVDVIIPGEAPLCALLMKHGISRVDDVPIVDALGATIKMAESMVDLKRSSGLAPARHGYFTDKPPRERLKELFALYGIDRLQPWKSIAFLAGIVFAVLAASAQAAAAPGYPVKPVRLVVPFAAGGGTDITARAVAQKLSVALGQSFIVDNRGGAGGVIGADTVAKATPDGYTLVLGSPGPLTINPNLQSKMPYDTLKDFSPISLMTVSPFMLVVHPGLPVSSVKDLIALAKEKPDALNYGSGGNGSVAHFSGEQFKALAGVKITHVPYKGSAPSIADLLGGRLQLVIDNLPVLLPHVRSGKVKGLAVGSTKRSALVPEFPTIAEAGVPGYESTTAFGILAPARTARPLVDKLSREIAAAIKAPDLREGLAARGFEPVGSTPEDYAEHLRNELRRYAYLVKVANIRLE